MAVVQLATENDVVDALGRALTPAESVKVGAILDKASELFRARSGQQFTPGDSTVRLKVNGGRVYLPQSPVVTVLSVTDDSGETVEHELFGQWLDVNLGSDRFVRVNYSHGADEVPDMVRLTVAEVAMKVLNIEPAALAGVTQRSSTSGPFTDSYSYAAWASGGQTMLSPSDNMIADSFRVIVPTVWVQSTR